MAVLFCRRIRRHTMAEKMRIVAIAAALATLLFAGVSASTSSHSKGTGEEWLSWTSEQRGVYGDAYLSGYVSGKTDACVAAAELFGGGKQGSVDDTVDKRGFRPSNGCSK